MANQEFIYILDDDPQYGAMLGETISDLGKTVIVETDPRHFLDNPKLDNSIVILDLVMPEMDGIEVIRALAERKVKLSVVLISGFDEQALHYTTKLAEAHMIEVLGSFTKPIELSRFKQFLTQVIAPAPSKPIESRSDLHFSLENIFENMHESLCILDTDYNIREINSAALKFEANLKEAMVGKSILEVSILAKEVSNATKLKTALDKAVSGQLSRIEIDIKNAEGAEFHILITIKPFTTDSGQHAIILEGKNVSTTKQQQTLISNIAKTLAEESGDAFFEELASKLSTITQCDFVLISSLEKDDGVNTLAYCAHGKIESKFSYDLKGTPCAYVIEKDTCLYSGNVVESFPDDPFLVDHGITSYAGTVLTSREGQPLGILAVMHQAPLPDPNILDILNIFSSRAATEIERRLYLKDLEETRKRLSLHLENTPLGVIELDSYGIITDLNTSAEHMFQLKRSDVIGKSANETIFSSLNQTELTRLLMSDSSQGQNIHNHTLNNGRKIQCQWFVTALTTDDKELGYAALVEDITERRETISALIRKETEQSEILNSMADGAITIDENGTILTFNKSAETLFGYNPEYILGQNVKLLMPEEVAGHHDHYISSYLKTGIGGIIGIGREVEGLHSSGRRFRMRLSVAELPKTESGVRRFIGTCHDLTLLQQKEQQLRHIQKMESLGKLTGGIAHDFNNILGIITGYADLLDALIVGEEKQEKYLKEIQQASKRGAKLTRKLLNISKVKPAETKTVNLNQILLDMENLLKKTLTPSIDIKLNLSEENCYISVDADSLEDTILNLSINAMHAIENEGNLTFSTSPNVLIGKQHGSILGLPSGKYHTFVIQDDGCGISREEQERVFEPFYSTKGEKGTGLGLSQVYSFMKQSEGIIILESEIGVGSQFTCYFPVASEKSQKPSSTETDARDLNSQTSECVLIVDDEESLLNATKEMLEKSGYRVMATTSPADALNIYQHTKTDIVVSDVIMPEMDGYELADKIYEINSSARILLVSGFSARTQKQKTHHLNQYVLEKPFQPKTLLRRMRQLLDGETSTPYEI